MTDQFKADTSVGYRHEVIPPDEPDCKYLERWILGFGRPGGNSWFSLRLHHFFRSDEDHLHDHPGWFWTLMLRGTYLDYVECEWCGGTGNVGEYERGMITTGPFRVTPEFADTLKCFICKGSGQMVGTIMRPGKIRYRPALHRHRVVTDGCWTLVLFGPRVRDWGFWVDGKWLKQRRYFRKFGGSAACE